MSVCVCISYFMYFTHDTWRNKCTKGDVWVDLQWENLPSFSKQKIVFIIKKIRALATQVSEWAKSFWYWSYCNETHRNDWSRCTNHLSTLHSTSAFVSWPLWPPLDLYGLLLTSNSYRHMSLKTILILILMKDNYENNI